MLLRLIMNLIPSILTKMNKITYMHPDFQDMLDFVPKEVARKVDLSFDISTRIGDILQRKGWSQADFAKAAGKKEAEISKWMSGQQNFTIRTIAFIETVLGEEILQVKQYRKSTSRKSLSTYAPGLLNDEGNGNYSKRK